SDRDRLRADARPDRSRLQRRAQLQLHAGAGAVPRPAAQRPAAEGMAPLACRCVVQAELRFGPGVNRLVRPDRPDRARAHRRRPAFAPARERCVSVGAECPLESIPHAFADGHVHVHEPVDPGSADHRGRMSTKRGRTSAKRGRTSAKGGRPIRKPVARTPVWVGPAAVAGVIAVVVATFLVIRWYTTPLAPKPPPTDTTQAIVSQITSQYVDFRGVESSDRNHQPLQSPSAAELQLISKYDTQGTIPFVDLGNRYAAVGAMYLPDVLANQTWQQVADDLKVPSSAQAQAIIGSA